jgi:hypothetical protein
LLIGHSNHRFAGNDGSVERTATCPQTERLKQCFKLENKIVPVLSAGNLLADQEKEIIT